MEVYFNNQFISVSESDGILELCFKKETKNLTDDDFKHCALKWIETVKLRKTKRLLVDMRDFNYELSPEIIDWRNKNVVAGYNEVGVERFAFVSNKPTVKQDDPSNTFVSRDFLTKQEAETWLRS
ncbi:MAG: hypothetical protein ISS93_00715 [Candidatus Aenigmarchaeota archaeon]|nr:hypothetical protein [Candidatus Aenigmarchaeota archaeon]